MGHFTWLPQDPDTCPPIPADACEVNYCPPRVNCSTQDPDLCPPIPADACDVNYCPCPIIEWPETNQGFGAGITIFKGEDGSDYEEDCLGVLAGHNRVRFPAIKHLYSEHARWFDGSETFPIIHEIQVASQIWSMIIQDSRGHLRNWRPKFVIGKSKLISKNQIMTMVADAYPALAEIEGAETVTGKPQFYLGANGGREACSTASAQTIQLLKITS